VTTLADAWASLPADLQDLLALVLYLLPGAAVGAAVLWGYRPFGLVGAMLWRFRGTNVLFVALIAASVGIGVGLIAQERGLRAGTARAAAKFDLVVAAPGSEVTLLLAAVYLQPADVPLLDGAQYDAIARHPRVALAAPIAFGDSVDGDPVVGSTPQFVAHLSDSLAEGRVFAAEREAVVGARSALAVGATFTPAHGAGEGADHDAHAGDAFTVVGRMRSTGSPWDFAAIVPVEAVWAVHGLATGHAAGWDGAVGPPFDAAAFPGTPAVLVRAEELWANYALRSEFNSERTMAFFPGAVLAGLHALLGDVRAAMSVLAVAAEALVTAGVLAGLLVLTRLYAQRLALLRAIGAPARFSFAVVWAYAATLIVAGAALGLVVGLGATALMSALVTARTNILVTADIGWPELHLVAGFVSLTILLALLPAFTAMSRDVVGDLRG
jgi:putative ABC transport system permease protein